MAILGGSGISKIVAERYGVIYKAINKSNNKVYIGQTIQNLKKRIQGHVSTANWGGGEKRNSYFMRALRKYGRDGFIWSVIDFADTKEELDTKEVFWIKQYNSNNPDRGYNMTSGGEGTVGFKHSEATKELLRKQKLGKRKSVKDIERLRVRMQGTNNPRASLTYDEVIKVKSLLTKGVNTHDISRLLGISRDSVSRIKLGKAYTNVEYPGFTIDKSKRSVHRYFTDEQVIEIVKLLLAQKLTYDEIAELFSATKKSIADIAIRKTYTNVKLPVAIEKEFNNYKRVKVKGAKPIKKKLSDTDVLAIYNSYVYDGDSVSSIANTFGVGKTTVIRILSGEAYTHVKVDPVTKGLTSKRKEMNRLHKKGGVI